MEDLLCLQKYLSIQYSELEYSTRLIIIDINFPSILNMIEINKKIIEEDDENTRLEYGRIKFIVFNLLLEKFIDTFNMFKDNKEGINKLIKDTEIIADILENDFYHTLCENFKQALKDNIPRAYAKFVQLSTISSDLDNLFIIDSSTNLDGLNNDLVIKVFRKEYDYKKRTSNNSRI